MHTVLTFDYVAVKAAYENAVNASSWRASYGDPDVTEPGLWFVKDEGIYLMSNASPFEENKTPVVYADTFHPKVDQDVWERSREAVGGDDFSETLSASMIAEVLAMYPDDYQGKVEMLVKDETISFLR